MMRWLDLVMSALFVWAAVLQLNDPDPVGWFAIYTAGAIVAAGSALAEARRLRSAALVLVLAAAGVAISCWVWAAVLASRLQGFAFRDLGAPMTPDHPEVEWARELLGLLIVGFWSGGVVLRLGRRARRRVAAGR